MLETLPMARHFLHENSQTCRGEYFDFLGDNHRGIVSNFKKITTVKIGQKHEKMPKIWYFYGGKVFDHRGIFSDFSQNIHPWVGGVGFTPTRGKKFGLRPHP